MTTDADTQSPKLTQSDLQRFHHQLAFDGGQGDVGRRDMYIRVLLSLRELIESFHPTDDDEPECLIVRATA